MDQSDKNQIDLVMNLRHWTGSATGPRHTCKCEECLAIKKVCQLARERVQSIDKKKV